MPFTLQSAPSDSLLAIHLSKGGKVSDKWSAYLPYYDSLFRPIRDLPIQLLEIGIQNGGSLEVWARYFKHAISIVGCDIDQKCGSLTFDDPNIHVIVANINSEEAYRSVARFKPFDAIIDDGSHQSRDILNSFFNYFPLIKPGGVYVVEDTHSLFHPAFGGGISNRASAKEFFKFLTDIVNYEFWSDEMSMEAVLSSFLGGKPLPPFIKEGWIESLEFRNSTIAIRKSLTPGHHKLGQRLVRGAEAIVNAHILPADGTTHPFK